MQYYVKWIKINNLTDCEHILAENQIFSALLRICAKSIFNFEMCCHTRKNKIDG